MRINIIIANRIGDILKYIENENKKGRMPSSTEIYQRVSVARTTSSKYLHVLESEEKITCVKIGQTDLWYITKNKFGDILRPKMIFVVEY